ncbi:hypothetical protein A0U90_10905 [Kozakia baliensis]|nr:hypothetical protein A0U90_10905 [Kozakia baliensis]
MKTATVLRLRRQWRTAQESGCQSEDHTPVHGVSLWFGAYSAFALLKNIGDENGQKRAFA